MSNNLDPDQARRFFGSDLGLNCCQKSSADDFGSQRVKQHCTFEPISFFIVCESEEAKAIAKSMPN